MTNISESLNLSVTHIWKKKKKKVHPELRAVLPSPRPHESRLLSAEQRSAQCIFRDTEMSRMTVQVRFQV